MPKVIANGLMYKVMANWHYACQFFPQALCNCQLALMPKVIANWPHALGKRSRVLDHLPHTVIGKEL